MSARILPCGAASSVERLDWSRTPHSAQAADPTHARDSVPDMTEDQAASFEAEIASRVEQVRLAARQEGETAGEARAGAALDHAIREFTSAVADLAALRPRLRKEAERDVVKLALAVARKILHRELSIDPLAILGIVKAALEQVDLGEIFRLRAHPRDAEAIERHLAASDLAVKVEVQAEASLARGSVILDANRGSFDAGMETQLDEIDRGFADLLGKR